MKDIPNFLESFKRILNSHKETQKLLSDSLYECLSIEIEPENFLIKKDFVDVNCDTVIKNEILFNKQKIMENFHKKGGSSDIVNIQ